MAGLAGRLVWLSWARLARRPVDSLAVLVASSACLIIIVNALVLQSGALPTPFSPVVASQPSVGSARPKAVQPQPLLSSADTLPAPQRVVARRNDPIAQLIGMSSRIIAVQRVLSEYGYGQIRPSGVLDRPTSAAIEKFEREHKLPVTGRISERLVSDLSTMTGRPLE
jgi:Putative peptidoglycan binding domain